MKRRRLACLPPGPVYRDIAPDREAVCLYDDDGEPVLTVDLPTRVMDLVRQLAKRDGLSLAKLVGAVLTAALDKFERGF